MSTSSFISRIRHRVDIREAEILRELGRGSAKDHAEYKLFVGRLRGLAELREMITETTHEMEIDADE